MSAVDTHSDLDVTAGPLGSIEGKLCAGLHAEDAAAEHVTAGSGFGRNSFCRDCSNHRRLLSEDRG